MITLDGITLDPNMYLGGIETAKLTSSTKVYTQDGVGFVMIKPVYGAKDVTLGTVNANGAQQGFWCQSVVDLLKETEQQALPVTLDYNGTVYTAVIVSTAGLTQFNQREPVSPSKAYTGVINLIIEV